MASVPHPLTPRQREVFAAVHHYHSAIGEPAPASFVAKKLSITKQRVQAYFQALNDLGWLRSAGSPAIPTRPLPTHEGLTNRQLPLATAARHASTVGKQDLGLQTVEMTALTLRAPVRSINVESRTAELVISTGARALRSGWDGPFYEELSLEKKHVRMQRLNNGAPLLNSHGGASGPMLEHQIGVVESARIEDGQIVGTVRFARAEDDPLADQVFRKVQDRIIRNVSVGYKTFRLEKIEEQRGAPPVFRATDWEPFEVSVVPMGVDDGAKFRCDKPEINPCEIVTRGAQENPMSDETRSETIAEIDPLLQPVVERKPQLAAAVPSEAEVATRIERERTQGILLGCRGVSLPQSFADKLIDDPNISLSDARGMILAEAANRGGDNRQTNRSLQDPIVGEDPLIHVRAGIEGALLHRIAPNRFQLDEKSRPYRGMSLLDIGRAFLHARGVRTTNMDRSKLVDALLTRAGLHTTSDFPMLFEDAANKNLRAAYEAAPQTWQTISKLVSLSDFKPSRQLQVGDAPALLEIMEHGEYTFGTIGEAKEVIQLKTYGRIFGITRQALINDDLNAFGEVPAAFGRKARDIESDLAWAQITSNPLMGDGVALFAAAAPPTGHANLTTGPGTAISIASLGVGRAALRNQKGVDLATLLNLSAKYLIVPAALETVADQFVTQITAAQSSNVNPFTAGGRTPLSVIVEPRLDVNSLLSWYMATDMASAPVLYHGVLDGQEGPLVTQQEGFDVDGMKFRCRIDVAFKAADWRAIYKNVGA